MKTQNEFKHRHQSDVERIQLVLLKNGHMVDLKAAAGIWEKYSDSFAAGWLSVPVDEDELWQEIKYRVEKKESDDVADLKITDDVNATIAMLREIARKNGITFDKLVEDIYNEWVGRDRTLIDGDTPA